MRHKPYQHYTRHELKMLLVTQCVNSNQNHFIDRVLDAVNDLSWSPTYEYDGCSIVQDPLHPFPPCFLHDYAWKVLGGGKFYDDQFYKDCIDWGINEGRVKRWYVGIRAAWLLWFKWKMLLNGTR